MRSPTAPPRSRATGAQLARLRPPRRRPGPPLLDAGLTQPGQGRRLPLQLPRVPRDLLRRLQGRPGAGQHQLPLRRRRARLPVGQRRRRGGGLPRAPSPSAASDPRPAADGEGLDRGRRRPGTRSRTGRVDYDDRRRRRAERSRHRPRGAARGDDLLLLYTGGTTGMPKGVMWRQDDLFHVLGARRQRPLHGTLPTARTADAAGATPGRPIRGRLHAAAPLMHGTGAVHRHRRLHRRRRGRLPAVGRNFDAVELLDEVERLKAQQPIAIVGTPSPSRCWTRSTPTRPLGPLEPARHRLVRRRCGATENKQGLLRHLPDCSIFDSLGSSEAVGMGASTSAAGADAPRPPSSRSGPTAPVFTEDGRRVEPGSGELGLVAVAGFLPVGYYKDPEKTAATFRTIEGVRWSVPGDFADGRRRRHAQAARPRLAGASTPAARRSSPKRSRRRSRRTPASATRSWSACPTSASASASAPWSRRPTAPRRRWHELVDHVRAASGRLQGPARTGRWSTRRPRPQRQGRLQGGAHLRPGGAEHPRVSPGSGSFPSPFGKMGMNSPRMNYL